MDENCNLIEMTQGGFSLGECGVLVVLEGLSLDGERVGIQFCRMVAALLLNGSPVA